MQSIYIIIPVYLMLFSCGIILFLFSILFKPNQPFTILGYKIQGIIPAALPGLMQSLKSFLPAMLPSFDSLEARFTKAENFEKIMPLIENHVDDFLRNKLSESMPMISMFIGDRTINQLKELFMRELRIIFPASIKSYLQGASAEFDSATLITDDMLKQAVATVQNNLQQIIHAKRKKALLIFGVAGLVGGIVLDLIICCL